LQLNLSASGEPLVTLTLVAYNGERWVPGCLDSVLEQDMPAWRLLALDNASTDGTNKLLRDYAARDGRIAVSHSPSNLGFAAGQNRLLGAVRTDFVILLNQDVELDRRFLGAALSAFDARPQVAAVQPRLRRLGAPGDRTNLLDSTGLQMHRDRRVVSRRQGHPERTSDLVPGPVWGADGPAPVFRRTALLEARLPRPAGGTEILDEDFFMYKEDVDLAWRLRVLGWGAWYEPTALAWHGRSAGGPARTILNAARSNRHLPPWIKALSWRNQRLMQFKNDDAAHVLRDLPWLLSREYLSLAFTLVADPTRLLTLAAMPRLLHRATRKRRTLKAAVKHRAASGA
jgi:GT2 family glycosyltransferase